jgi:hypothetical protein
MQWHYAGTKEAHILTRSVSEVLWPFPSLTLRVSMSQHRSRRLTRDRPLSDRPYSGEAFEPPHRACNFQRPVRGSRDA